MKLPLRGSCIRVVRNRITQDDGRTSMLSERWKAFSAADHIALEADTSWERLKNLGTEKLKCGDFNGAALLYKDAAAVAMGPLEGGLVDAFISALETWPAESAQRKLFDNHDLLWFSVVPKLPISRYSADRTIPTANGTDLVGKYPNKSVAIAWANCAQALLADGKPQDALESARQATEANPEYLKGHHREMKALEALGRTAEAKKIAEEMRDFSLARSTYPAESLALLQVGWIGWERAQLIYNPTRFSEAAKQVASELTADLEMFGQVEMKVEARASIVPFQGGQCLMLSLVYGNGMETREVQCMDFYMVDHQHAEIADRPPNGHASPQALTHAPMRIGVFIEELKAYDLVTVAVMCGQGLTQHVDLIKEKLETGCRHGMHPPMNGIIVYAAESTAASEAIGTYAPLDDIGRAAAMEAMMARLDMWL